MGLSVVRRIVELHGGYVTATSAGSHAGSEFVVSLPVSTADERDDGESQNLVKTTTGIEMGRLLRQRFPPRRLRLIALSGYAGADLRERCLAEGFDAYLTKPGDISQLERLLGGGRSDSDTSEH